MLQSPARDRLILIKALFAALSVTFLLLLAVSSHQQSLGAQNAALSEQHRRLAEAEAAIRHFDEVLTMSARLGAATGDGRWERRYRLYEPDLDASIKSVQRDAPASSLETARALDAANVALVEMEYRSFDLTRKGRSQEALRLLMSPRYEEQKSLYTKSLLSLEAASALALRQSRDLIDRSAALAHKVRGAALCMILLTWFLTFRFVRQQSHGRDAVEDALLAQRSRLEGRMEERTRQLETSNASLLAEVETRKTIEQRQQAQLEVSVLLSMEMAPAEMYLKVLETICRVLGWKEGAVWEIDEDAGLLRFAGFYQSSADSDEFEAITRSTTFKKGVGMPGRVWETGRPAWIDNVQEDANFPRAPYAARSGLHAAFGLPIVSSGRIVGVLEFFREKAEEADQGLLETMKVVGVHLGQFLERERVRKAHEAAQEQLLQAQKMEAVGKLAGGVAHDFNNILTVILGCCDNLRSTFPAEDSRLEDVLEISDFAKRAATLTRQLLAFSRRQVLRPAAVDINQAVSNLQGMFQRLLPETISLHVDLEPGLAGVLIDPGQFDQVLVNLVVNARDAMAKGGRLHLKTREILLDRSTCERLQGIDPGPYLALSVSDTGVGMSPQVLARVFEPFFTTKALGKGTGLGLAMAYGIIRQSNGAIEASSEPGKGSCFSVYLPRVAAAAPANPGKSAGMTRGTETVLLVEDEEPVRRIARRILGGCGYSVLEAGNAEEALKLLEREPATVDLLLTDVVMPGMNGRDLAEAVRRRRPSVKILLMSGYADNLPPAEGPAKMPLMEKPFSAEVLARSVRAALEA